MDRRRQTLSSLGVYSTDLTIPLGAFAAGLGDHQIVTSLCPGGKERMRRLMSVIQSGRLDLSPTGGAAKNLDWLSSDPQAPAMLDGAAESE